MDYFKFYEKYDKCFICGASTRKALWISTVMGNVVYTPRTSALDLFETGQNFLCRESSLPTELSLSDLSPLATTTTIYKSFCDSSPPHKVEITAFGFAPKREVRDVHYYINSFGIRIATSSAPSQTQIAKDKRSIKASNLSFDYFDFSSAEKLNDQVEKLLLLL